MIFILQLETPLGPLLDASKDGSQSIQMTMGSQIQKFQYPWLRWLQQRCVNVSNTKHCTDCHQLYATIYEWRTGEQVSAEFSANAYLDVYFGHVHTLNYIAENQEDAYLWLWEVGD